MSRNNREPSTSVTSSQHMNSGAGNGLYWKSLVLIKSKGLFKKFNFQSLALRAVGCILDLRFRWCSVVVLGGLFHKPVFGVAVIRLVKLS